MEITISDHFEPTLAPVCSLKPCFALENGIFSPLERLQFGGAKISRVLIESNTEQNLRCPGFYEKYFEAAKISVSWSIKGAQLPQPVVPDTLLSQFRQNLVGDVHFLSRDSFVKITPPILEGSAADVWIHKDAQVSPMAAINTKNGPVVIDKNVTVSAFCLLTGPLYVGPDSHLDRVAMSNSRAGRHCRLGGEISDSIIGNFTNKHHEGFLGHSIVGDWVNLGALTTTSDLKNNYGQIQLQYEDKTYPTGRIKFGSIIGDFVKTGIGAMLNTGTILNTGAMLYQGFAVQKYYPRFFWGGPVASKYRLDRFLADIEKIMGRRNQSPDAFLTGQIRHLYGLSDL